MIALLTLANLAAAVRLIVDMLTRNKLFANNATGLLATGGVIRATNCLGEAQGRLRRISPDFGEARPDSRRDYVGTGM